MGLQEAVMRMLISSEVALFRNLPGALQLFSLSECDQHHSEALTCSSGCIKEHETFFMLFSKSILR